MPNFKPGERRQHEDRLAREAAQALKDRMNGRVLLLVAAPDEMLLAPGDVSALTGFAEETLRLWRKQNRGPNWRMVEGMPRLTLGEYRRWINSTE